jgi:cell division protein FtsN
MKRAITGLLVALLAAGAVGCGSSKSKTETSEGIAEPGALAPRTPSEVRVQEAEEKQAEVEAREKKDEEAKEAQKRREEEQPAP